MCLLWLNSFTRGGLQCAWSASILCDALTAASLQNTTLCMASFTKLSSYIFEWDREDVQCLKEAKRAEWKSSHSGHAPTEEQLMATISPGELKRHCRRRIRGVEEIRSMISGLLESVWELTCPTFGRCSRSTWSASKTLQVLNCTHRWGHSRFTLQ